MRKIARSLLFVIVAMLSWTNAMATGPSYAVRCDRCTGQQAKDAASTIAAFYRVDPAATAAGYYGYVYSYDFVDGTITQYGVVLSTKRGGLTAMPIGPAPADIANAYMIQRNAIRANGAAGVVFEFHDNVSDQPSFPDRASTAIDVARTTSIQNDISDWLLMDAPTNDWAIAAALDTLMLKDLPIAINMVWTTLEGGKITMQLPLGEHAFKFVKAVDQNNNTIPMTADQVGGDYKFGKGGGPNFSGYLHDRFGYSTSGHVCVNGILACTDVSGSRACVWLNCDGSP